MAFSKFIRAVGKGEEISIFGDGTQGRDFTFVSDTVAATILASKAESGSVYNVGTGSVHTVQEALAIAGKLLGREPKVSKLPMADGDVRTTCGDITRIKNELGFEPKVNLETGLGKQVAASAGPKSAG